MVELRSPEAVIVAAGVNGLPDHYYGVVPQKDAAGFAIFRHYPPGTSPAAVVTRTERPALTCMLKLIVEGLSETKAISVALWDHIQKNTLRIDLWTKEMPVEEMKRFYVDCLGGIAQNVLTATGDEHMSQEINSLCDRLVSYLKK